MEIGTFKQLYTYHEAFVHPREIPISCILTFQLLAKTVVLFYVAPSYRTYKKVKKVVFHFLNGTIHRQTPSLLTNKITNVGDNLLQLPNVQVRFQSILLNRNLKLHVVCAIVIAPWLIKYFSQYIQQNIFPILTKNTSNNILNLQLIQYFQHFVIIVILSMIIICIPTPIEFPAHLIRFSFHLQST